MAVCARCGCGMGATGCGCPPHAALAGFVGLGAAMVLGFLDHRLQGSFRRAPGYASYAWTTQDWRVVVPKRRPEVDYEDRCGAPSNRTRDGHVRLCLPLAVIERLSTTKQGREILWRQARLKEKAAPGTRVAWHPMIRRLYAELEAQTEPDDPSLRRRR